MHYPYLYISTLFIGSISIQFHESYDNAEESDLLENKVRKEDEAMLATIENYTKIYAMLCFLHIWVIGPGLGQSQAKPSQANILAFGLACDFTKPEPPKARPKPRLSGQARAGTSLFNSNLPSNL